MNLFEGKPTITLSGERGEFWESMLGTRTLPILDPTTTNCELEGDGEKPCFMLDIRALSNDQLKRVIEGLAKRFRALQIQVRHDVLTRGVPIRFGEDVTVTIPEGYQPKRPSVSAGAAIDMRMLI